MSKLNDELLKIVDSLFRTSEKDHAEVLKQYKQSQDNIINFFNNLYVKYGSKGQIKYSELLKYNRMDLIKKFLNKEADNNAKQEISIVAAILYTLFALTYYKHAYTMEQTLGITVNFKKLKQDFINQIVNSNWTGTATLKERILNNHISMANKLQIDFIQKVRIGRTSDQIAKDVQKLFATRFNQSESLMFTESTRIITEAQEEIFKDSKIVEGVKFTAVLDNRTTQFCREHDGIQYALDDPNRPYLPAHIRCRSVWTPILINDLSKYKKAESKSSFEDWLSANGVTLK